MNEISPHIGREQDVQALGKTWKLARWERRVWWDLLAWARLKIPDPVDLIAGKLALMPEPIAKHAVDAALRASRTFLSINSAEVQSLLASLEGSVYTVWLLLREHQPNVTEDEAYKVVLDIGKDNLPGIFAIALGKSPEKKTEKPVQVEPLSTIAALSIGGESTKN